MKKLPILPSIKIEIRKDIFNPREQSILCILHWLNLPEGVKNDNFSISLLNTPTNMKLAERFKKAVSAGAVYKNPRILQIEERKLDKFELSYVPKNVTTMPAFKLVRYDGFVMAKHLNSDLKKLGF